MKEKVIVNGKEYSLYPIDTEVLVDSQKEKITERIITENGQVYYKVGDSETFLYEAHIQAFKSV